jgi:DNA-cytosine methyltransferase
MRSVGRWKQILVLEDDGATSRRRSSTAVGDALRERVIVRLHSIRDGASLLLNQKSYRAGSMIKRGRGAKAELALRMIDENLPRGRSVVVAGATYGSNGEFLDGLLDRGLPFVTEVRASELLSSEGKVAPVSRRRVEQMLDAAPWRKIELPSPGTGRALLFSVAPLHGATPHQSVNGRLFAAQTGSIDGVHRGTIIGFASLDAGELDELVRAVVWARWIRPVVRRSARGRRPAPHATSAIAARESLTVRANITLAGRQDDRRQGVEEGAILRGALGSTRSKLNVVELFAGAGGMGLGFLLASTGRGCRVVFSGEVNPIYAATLQGNRDRIAETRGSDSVPAETQAVDLRTAGVLADVKARARRAGGVDIVIGGPPCQGFSNANRNSWSRTNPNNKLVDVFISYVETLLPPVFVMENVQGILWTSKAGVGSAVSVVDDLARRMRRAGYDVFPRLLDAVWYGAPQFRSRFFLVGVHRDLGYRAADFGAWGPFPAPTHGPAAGRPYVTVDAAIGDLPHLGNGSGVNVSAYAEPPAALRKRNPFLAFVRDGARRGVVHDHITSKHAAYVIDRYRQIPPGGNWEAIVDTMSNYADVERTHSNIYRRLRADQPAITIGHYRKSMLVHPRQHRGLSLREAARLQSFPDWFRFAGRADGGEGGLVHKQQQLANAVCPLVSKALAEYLLRL